MAALSNQLFRVAAGSPKTAVIQETGLNNIGLLGASGVGIYFPVLLAADYPQVGIGALESVHTYAQSILNDLSTLAAPAPLKVQLSVQDGGDTGIVVGGDPDFISSVILYVGTDIANKRQSHALDATFKQLVAAALESTKAH